MFVTYEYSYLSVSILRFVFISLTILCLILKNLIYILYFIEDATSHHKRFTKLERYDALRSLSVRQGMPTESVYSNLDGRTVRQTDRHTCFMDPKSTFYYYSCLYRNLTFINIDIITTTARAIIAAAATTTTSTTK